MLYAFDDAMEMVWCSLQASKDGKKQASTEDSRLRYEGAIQALSDLHHALHECWAEENEE